jgi:hypothetical protein
MLAISLHAVDLRVRGMALTVGGGVEEKRFDVSEAFVGGTWPWQDESQDQQHRNYSAPDSTGSRFHLHASLSLTAEPVRIRPINI